MINNIKSDSYAYYFFSRKIKGERKLQIKIFIILKISYSLFSKFKVTSKNGNTNKGRVVLCFFKFFYRPMPKKTRDHIGLDICVA